MEIAFACEHRCWWWCRNESNVIRKCGQGKIWESKRKTLSFVSYGRHISRTFPIKSVSIAAASDKKKSEDRCTREKSGKHLHAEFCSKPCETIRLNDRFVGLFTQHQTFTFSQQFNAHQKRSSSYTISRSRCWWWWNSECKNIDHIDCWRLESLCCF